MLLRALCMAGKAAAVAPKFATVCIVCTRLYLVRAVCMHTLVSDIEVVYSNKTLHVLFGGDETYMYAMYVCVFIQ